MRNELERAEGYFPVPMPGGEVRLPELSWGDAAEWARVSAAAFGPVFAEFERDWKPGDGLMPVEMANQSAMDTIIERIVAYDVDGVLGGTAGIAGKGRLRGGQIKDLYSDLYEAAHPFDADLQAALVQMATIRVNAMLAVQLAGASSTNGSSPAGASRRERRARSSQPRNSTSSGKSRSTVAIAKLAPVSASSISPSAMPSPRRTSVPASGRPRAT